MKIHPIIYFSPESNRNIINERPSTYILNYSMIYNNISENRYQFIKNWKYFGIKIRKLSK